MFDEADRARIAAIQRKSPVRRVREIAEAVSAETLLPVDDILGTSRVAVLAEARQVVMYIARREGFTFPAIARAMGLDPSTVQQGVKRESACRMAAPRSVTLAGGAALVKLAECR